MDQGYVLRRLLRRAVRYARTIDLDSTLLTDIAKMYIDKLSTNISVSPPHGPVVDAIHQLCFLGR